MTNMPLLGVDFNELQERDLVLLSVGDIRLDYQGHEVTLEEGMAVTVYMDDTEENGPVDILIASGVVERNVFEGWGAHVKWCCRIDANGIRYQSERLSPMPAGN